MKRIESLFPLNDKDIHTNISKLILFFLLYLQAYQVLGYFLGVRKDEIKFKGWLKMCGLNNSEQEEECYQCISEWSIKLGF